MLLSRGVALQATQQDMQTLSRSLQEMNAPEFLEVWLVLHLCRVGSLQVCHDPGVLSVACRRSSLH